MSARVRWKGDHEFTVGDVSYRSAGQPTAPDQLAVLKPRSQVEFYEALIRDAGPRSIVELGIYAGGSTALLAQLAAPEKLVAIDIRSGCPALERFVDVHGLTATVVPYYGVDQSDVGRLREIVATEFRGEPLDLVIDDASHFHRHTKASFNVLFPHLRPGGLYVIEDWSWAHYRMPHPDPKYQGVRPLSAFVCELVLAAACRPQVVSEVRVDQHSAVVRRGPAELEPSAFDLNARFDPVAKDMSLRLSRARSLSTDAEAPGPTSP
jgi:predicted O-methyltransferase YrrM